jgi:hypothetical protein
MASVRIEICRYLEKSGNGDRYVKHSFFCLSFVVTFLNCAKVTESSSVQVKGGKALDDKSSQDEKNRALYTLPLVGGPESDGLCTSVVIGPQTLLTAAHCVTKTPLKVVDLCSPNRVFIEADSFAALNPKIEETDPDLDLAVVTLKSNLVNCKPIELAKEIPFGQSEMIVMGFGRTENESLDGKLRTAVVNINGSHTREKATMGLGLGFGYILSSAGNGSLCPGDSGGPAIMNGKLVGIASLSVDITSARLCSKANRVVHTNVTKPEAYSWIMAQKQKGLDLVSSKSKVTDAPPSTLPQIEGELDYFSDSQMDTYVDPICSERKLRPRKEFYDRACRKFEIQKAKCIATCDGYLNSRGFI